jgi:hypothetical protein
MPKRLRDDRRESIDYPNLTSFGWVGGIDSLQQRVGEFFQESGSSYVRKNSTKGTVACRSSTGRMLRLAGQRLSGSDVKQRTDLEFGRDTVIGFVDTDKNARSR